jgi:signal transduction histidine kinase/FixJ family two-component response regulator
MADVIDKEQSEPSSPAGWFHGTFSGGEMGARIRDYDWASTPLGPPASWPQSLKTSIGILLASSFPTLICWGPSYIQLYNDAFRPVLGASKHPAGLGQSTYECFAEVWDYIGPLFRQAIETGEPTFQEDQLFPLHRYGYLEECYFTFCYSAIPAEDGPGGVLASCIETTERCLSERRVNTLKEVSESTANVETVESACAQIERALSRNPFDVPFALLYLLDPDGMVARLACSSGLATGPDTIEMGEPAGPWPLNEVAIGKPRLIRDLALRFGTLIGQAWPEPISEALILPLAQQGTEGLAGYLVVGINPRRALDNEYRGLLNLLAGQVTTAIGSAQAYEAERRRAEALAALDRAKTDFFSNISHEFRTPLTLMLGPLEALIEEEAPNSPKADRLQLAHRNALRLLRLVNTLLDFSRVEGARMHASYQPTDIKRLTEDVASSFRSAIESARLTFKVEAQDLGEPAYVDPEMWEKILLNLLSNAFKFTRDGEIVVKLRRADTDFELAVRDTGCGIPTEEIPHLFERFHRVRGSEGRTHEGTGIGLALVRELVKLHGGEILVDSAPSAGSTFTVRVPMGSAHLPREQVADHRSGSELLVRADLFTEEAKHWDHAKPRITTSPTSARRRVLVADDNADMLRYVVGLLSPHYEIVTAPDGQSALEAIAADPPELIVADIMMPRLDGFGLLRGVRGNAVHASIPVILLSARAGEEARVSGFEAGADDYLVKPFTAAELLARVDAHLSLAQLRQNAAADRERLLSELESERQLLGLILDCAPSSSFILRGPDFVYEYANAPYLDHIGMRNIIGRRLLDVRPEIRGRGFIELLHEVRRTGKPYVGTGVPVLISRPAGSEPSQIYMDFVYLPLPERDGAIDRILVHSVEVTDRVMYQRRMEQLTAELEDRVEERTQELQSVIGELEGFTYSVAHDLRSPLRAISGTSRMLREDFGGALNEEARSLLDRQCSAAGRLGNLIDDLLKLSRLSRQPIKKGDVDMSALAESIAELVARDNPGSPVSLDIQAGMNARGDQRLLQFVFQNLIENAVKFSPKGGTIRVGQGSDGAFFVADDGIGFEEVYAAKIFEPFQRLVLDAEFPGTGIGLANAKRVIERHGGRIWAQGELGKGATFWFTLP